MKSFPCSIQFYEFLPNKYSCVITVTKKIQNSFDHPQEVPHSTLSRWQADSNMAPWFQMIRFWTLKGHYNGIKFSGPWKRWICFECGRNINHWGPDSCLWEAASKMVPNNSQSTGIHPLVSSLPLHERDLITPVY